MSKAIKERLEALKSMEIQELREQLVQAKDELFSLRFQLSSNALTNNQRVGEVKKDIARIKTIASQKSMESELG